MGLNSPNRMTPAVCGALCGRTKPQSSQVQHHAAPALGLQSSPGHQRQDIAVWPASCTQEHRAATATGTKEGAGGNLCSAKQQAGKRAYGLMRSGQKKVTNDHSAPAQGPRMWLRLLQLLWHSLLPFALLPLTMLWPQQQHPPHCSPSLALLRCLSLRLVSLPEATRHRRPQRLALKETNKGATSVKYTQLKKVIA
ncbi:hypothetical protein NDU88_002485 [Pleurodeles waltl]|uniref:Uncharacterized protein n=1 Tax=Pleurodeles waltl TaxID=8319 RepID=A0AAV7TLZ1_PLEWA|nr:hypothetical protein NDU88_002485 [Pleurodeles waltl]